MTTVIPGEDKIIFNDYVMKNRFRNLLSVGGRVIYHPDYPDDLEYTFKISELREMTRNMMHFLDLAYDPGDGPFRKIDDFSEEEKIALRPFAYFLSILAGNAFYNPDPKWHDQTQRGFLDAYIPEAFAFLGDRHDVLDHLVKLANERLND